MNDQENPFAALLKPPEGFSEKESESNVDNIVSEVIDRAKDREQIESISKQQIDVLLQKIFLLTVNTGSTSNPPELPSHCVLLPDLSSEVSCLDESVLDQAVFERLSLSDPGSHVVGVNQRAYDDLQSLAAETKHFTYLFNCYQRMQQEQKNGQQGASVFYISKKIVLSYACTCLINPAVFDCKNIHKQLLEFYLDSSERSADEFSSLTEFLGQVSSHMECDEDQVKASFLPVLNLINLRLRAKSAHPLNQTIAQFVLFMAQSAPRAKVLMHHMTPRDVDKGTLYEDSVIGGLLGLSCLSKTGPGEFFDKPSSRQQHEHTAMESRLWQFLDSLTTTIHQIIHALLKIPETKQGLLNWIGGCLNSNAGRIKMWNRQMQMQLGNPYASDGFFLNLGAVLLKLCNPFMKSVSADFIFKIDCTYCVSDKGCRIKDLHKETMLANEVKGDEGGGSSAPGRDAYGFVTECFFLTHRCLHLGFSSLHGQYMKLNNNLHQMQSAYRDAQRVGGNQQNLDTIRQQMDTRMSVYLAMKTVLTQPQMLEGILHLDQLTAEVLMQGAMGNRGPPLRTPSLPLPESGGAQLAFLPEFLLENLVDSMLFLHRFSAGTLESDRGRQCVASVASLAVMFMGEPRCVKNPHLRARLPETLEVAVIPSADSASSNSWQLTPDLVTRSDVLQNMALAESFVESLIRIFNDIEFTGDEHMFEQKFQYRRPMYKLLSFVWQDSFHKERMKKLSEKAIADIDANDPPVFLRFINILINDAVFLLDEAMKYLAQIRDFEKEKERGEWSSLDPPQRRQKESHLLQLGRIARWHNVLANETIHTLAYLTQAIQDVFCHDVMRDRVAAMLNYFLVRLVGPQMGKLKVRDFSQLDFKPQQLVSDICEVYVNLGSNDAFCLAVSQDGRSYSHGLFADATKALEKIHHFDNLLANKLTTVAKRIKELGEEKQAEDEIINEADIPEEFLDPLMSTLMTEPVILPSTKTVIDRSTIARHLLSDQSDPFNRTPLTMDQVQPAPDIKAKIEKWIKEQKQLRKPPPQN